MDLGVEINKRWCEFEYSSEIRERIGSHLSASALCITYTEKNPWLRLAALLTCLGYVTHVEISNGEALFETFENIFQCNIQPIKQKQPLSLMHNLHKLTVEICHD